MVRYGIGRTNAFELANSEAFVRSVVPGMHVYPLSALRAVAQGPGDPGAELVAASIRRSAHKSTEAGLPRPGSVRRSQGR